MGSCKCSYRKEVSQPPRNIDNIYTGQWVYEANQECMVHFPKLSVLEKTAPAKWWIILTVIGLLEIYKFTR
jgi:hypothetical protein